MTECAERSDGLRRRCLFPLLLGPKWTMMQRCAAELEESQWLAPENLRALQLRKLSALLKHADRSFPFYRDAFAAAGARPDALGELEDLARFPILEKADVRVLGAEVSQSRGVTVRTTAGSSGEPTRVLASAQAHAWSLAARFRSQGWHGIGIGAREARFWGRSVNDGLAQRARNRILNRALFTSPDIGGAAMARSLDRWRSFDPDYIYGYVSLVRRFASLARGSGFVFSPGRLAAAIVTAESSTDAERAATAAMLGCPVIEEYGCSECDIIAFECPSGSLHVIAENVLVERLPVADDPGVCELLVTDLNNLHMPLIRYRVGDLVAAEPGACSCGRGLPVLTGLRGRSQEQYIRGPGGQRIRSSEFAYILDDGLARGLPIRQFQIRQESIGGMIVLVVLEGESPEAGAGIESGLKERAHHLLGAEFECRVEFVDEIPVEPGRKFSYFISELTK